MKEVTEESLKACLEGLMASMDGETAEMASANALFQYLKDRPSALDDAENLDLFVRYNHERVLEYALKKLKGIEDPMALDVYIHWDFYDSHATRLCKKFYGSICSADKGRTIVNKFIRLRAEGECENWDWGAEYTYGLPESGSADLWMIYMESLYRLRSGRPDAYFTALNDLHNSHAAYKKNFDAVAGFFEEDYEKVYYWFREENPLLGA